MIVDKPIDHAIYLVLENQIAIMQALVNPRLGLSILPAHIQSAEAAMRESDRLRREAYEANRP